MTAMPAPSAASHPAKSTDRAALRGRGLGLRHPNARFSAMPILALLLGLALIGGTIAYAMLGWQRRVALESERGASVVALAEMRVNEAVGGVTTALNMLASRRAWTGGWAGGITRAVQAGGRVGSVSLLSPTGEVEFSTAPRNIGLRLAPEEFGGGWSTARFGVGALFQGRDLADRRASVHGDAANFIPISVPVLDGDGFIVATLSLRSLQVSLSAFLIEAEAHGIGLYWRDGGLIQSVGRAELPPVLPAAAIRAIAATDRYQPNDPSLSLVDIPFTTCRSSRSNPFILCVQQTVGSLSREWQDWRGGAFAALVLAVSVLVAGATRIAADHRRQEREREDLRRDLARSDRRQRAALESATGLVWECDATRTTIRYFGNFSRLLGNDAPAEEPFAAFLERLRPQDGTSLADTLAAWGESDEDDHNTLVQRAWPAANWLRISGRRAASADQGLLGTMADVTDLLEISERYRAIFREVAQPILLLDEAGVVEEVNPAAEAAFCHPDGALPGRSLGDLVCRASAAGRVPATLSDIAADASAGTLTGLRADGANFPLAVATGTWVVDGQHKIIAILRDLSAEREIERHLREAKLSSDMAAHAKSDFLSTMSHEIRTPLNGVIGTAGLLADTSLNPVQARYVTVLQDSADHLLQLINDILDLSKLDATRIELEEAPFDVADLVTGALDLMSSRASAKGLRVTSRIDPDVPHRLTGDVGRVRQVLLNLIGNAIKFTAAGTVSLEVSGHNPVSFAIRDTGIGIPADQLSRLFGNFVQLDGSFARRFGGTGLGLAISQRLAVRMGGAIAVTSTAGQGSAFVLSLPLAAAGADFSEPVQTAATVPTGLHILVAEDNLTNQLVTRNMLEAMGHRVQVVADGEEAVDAVMARHLDVVLMDVMMPRMDGLAATRAIRAMDHFATLPVVAVTAGAFAHDYEACMAAGMSGLLAKPFSRRALQSALAEALSWHTAKGGEHVSESPRGENQAAATRVQA